MQSSNIPLKIQIPFANSAGSSYKNTIPQASQIGITNGKASLTDGFPPLTFQPISSGGIPPFGADFNGILYEITAIQQWQEAGGMFPYDSSFSTTIGGYPKGAVLQAAAFGGLWVNTIENNTSNPDTGGAGWSSLAFEGSQSVTVTTADVTLTSLQAAYPVLIISGTLTGNRNLIFPAAVGEYIVQNNTTGAYTLTAKTASGTGVTLTQNASTYLYGDGTNINFADSAKVASFNGRTGTVTLTSTDVTSALGYVPVNKTGDAMTGTLTSSGYLAGTSPNSGVTGAVRLYDAVGNPNAVYLQATNNAGTVSYSSLYFNSNGAISASGSFSAISFSGAGTGLTGKASSLSIGGSADSLNAANSYNVYTLIGSNIVAGTSPNNGQTGAIRAYDAPGNPDAVYIQGVNNSGSVGYANIKLNANGLITSVGGAPSTGNSSNYIATSAFVQDALTGGTGQSWQAPGRSAGVTYTNSTGRPILVMLATANSGSPTAYTYIYVNGVNIVNVGTSNDTFFYSFIVPNGATYLVNLGGSGIISQWAELR